MMSNTITVRASIQIQKPVAEVFDYTQNWQHRMDWDASILGVEVKQEEPHRLVQVRASGGMSFQIEYKHIDRPHLTSLVMTDHHPSWLMNGGGGSWQYEDVEGGTRWTQNNTLVVPNPFLYWLLRPMLQWQLQKITLQAMTKAKAILEKGK